MQNLNKLIINNRPGLCPGRFNTTQSSEKIYYIPPFTYSIYEISGQVEKKYQFDFGSRNIPEDLYEKFSSEEQLQMEIDERRYCSSIQNFYENQNYVVCQFFCNRFIQTVIYSKKTQQHKCYALIGSADNLRNISQPGIKGLNENDEIIYVADASVYTGLDDPHNDAYNQFKKNIRESDNPILMYQKIKSF